MIHVSQNSTMIGMVELRTVMPKISKELKGKKIIIVNRGKPVAILQDFDEYETKEKLIEEFEDTAIGHIAKERAKDTKIEDYIDEEKVAQDLNINL